MLISIIIPVYNVAPYLHDCLDSVLKQDISECEVICVNDGSTDGSISILEGYKKLYPEVKLISQENKGLSAARNAGLKASKGDYVLFLDSDDWLSTDALQILHDQIGNEDMLCFNGRRFFEDGTMEEPDAGINEPYLTGWGYYNNYALILRKFHFVCVVLRLYRRQFLFDNNLFFEEGVFHEDNLFTPIACYYAHSVKVIPDCIYIYRIRENSIMTTSIFKRVEDKLKSINNLSAFFSSKNEIEKSVIYKVLASDYINVFSIETKMQYGNRDYDLKRLIDWNAFRKVAVAPRQHFLYILIRIHPSLFRQYSKLTDRLSKV
jgi:glycosyltransferase involved in cell wall biosynthesis